MKIESLLEQEMQDPEFAQAYQVGKERSASGISLNKAREKAGLTQAELAERAGVLQSTIAQIERGDNVTFDKLATIAHAMGKHVKVEIS